MEERLAQLMETIERTNEQNAATFAKISSRFDEVAEMVTKKPKIDRSILEFKSKGNEDQFVFVEKIEERLKDSSKELERISAAITATVPDPPEVLTQAVAKTKRSLDDGMSLVSHRQKLIRLADRSENGWKVVKEYESDSLADNEDDEKRIAKAEKAAASAAAAKSKKRAPSKPFV